MSVKRAQENISTAIIPYKPPKSSQEFLQSQVQRIANETFRKSLEQAKSCKFTGRNFFQITSASLSPPKGLKTDSRIEIEIFASTPNDHKSPILIFSHGWGESPRNYRTLLGELASHGYTVLSLNHLSSAETLDLPPEEEDALTDKLADVMANNIQYVIGKVRSGLLKNLGDPNEIILAGHSLGGAASVNVSRTDPAISGCVNLDGFLKGETKTEGLTQPLLMITGDYQKGIREMEQHPEEEVREYAKSLRKSLEEYEILRHNSPHSEKILIPQAGHMDFTDKPFHDYLAGEKEKKLSTAMRVHTIVSSEVLKFLRLCSSK